MNTIDFTSKGPNAVDQIEKILHEYAGPFAHFVIKKQLKVLGADKNHLSGEQLNKFIELVVKSAIMDPKMAAEARKRMKKKFIFN